MNIPIIVVAYNRTNTLQRLLSSLSKAHFPFVTRLIISIDGGGPESVIQTAKDFFWKNGQKEIIEHSENLGLRNHILSCSAFSKKYDGIILLEDDLYVSPWFYPFALSAARFYRGCKDISGIALYSPRYNETAFLPFYPLNDGSDTFFMQLACSWGQIWLSEQWSDFENWYYKSHNEELIKNETLPINVKSWPETSWKKYYTQYMILKNKYFAYPRHSYTTNFGDKGQHHNNVKIFQVPLITGTKETFNFAELDNSKVKYDAFCEIDSNCLKSLNDKLNGYEFEVDLYGTKERHHFNKGYVLTSKKCTKYLESFDKSLIPIENNIIESITGNKLFFAKVEDVVVEKDLNKYIFLRSNNMDEHKYFYPIGDLHFKIRNDELERLKKPLNYAKKHKRIILKSYIYRILQLILIPFIFAKRLLKSIL